VQQRQCMCLSIFWPELSSGVPDSAPFHQHGTRRTSLRRRHQDNRCGGVTSRRSNPINIDPSEKFTNGISGVQSEIMHFTEHDNSVNHPARQAGADGIVVSEEMIQAGADLLCDFFDADSMRARSIAEIVFQAMIANRPSSQ
jgi:hypothetical protein